MTDPLRERAPAIDHHGPALHESGGTFHGAEARRPRRRVDETAVEEGMRAKAEEFQAGGEELYVSKSTDAAQ